LFVSDWVLSNYELHGRGAIWHVRQAKPGELNRAMEPRQALASLHRPVREAAARQLAEQNEGRVFLREQVTNRDVRIRTQALTALIDAGDGTLNLTSIAEKDPLPEVRAIAVRALVARGKDARPFLDTKQPGGVRAQAVAAFNAKCDLAPLQLLLTDAD